MPALELFGGRCGRAAVVAKLAHREHALLVTLARSSELTHFAASSPARTKYFGAKIFICVLFHKM